MEDYKYKLSIIIPMYNAEKYIANCLDSIFGSDLPAEDYEVVVVNDGSKDKGPEIVAEYMKQHPNLSYYSQENQGQSTARNNGIKVAKGEYVWCVDADDAVESRLQVVINNIGSFNGIDIFAILMKVVWPDHEEMGSENKALQHNQIMTGRDAVINGYEPASVCAFFIRRNFIISHNLFFKVGITHQDVELTYRLMSNASKVYFSNFVCYQYLKRNESTSVSRRPEKKIKYLSDDIVVSQSFAQLAASFRGHDDELADVIDDRAKSIHLGILLNLFTHRKEFRKNGVISGVLEKMKNADYFPLKGDFGSTKRNVLSKILNIIFKTWLS